MKFLFNIGVTEELSELYQAKVRLANQIASMFVFVALSYMVFSIFYYPPLVMYPASAAGLACSIFIFNSFQWHHLSRFIMSFQALLLTAIYHAYLVTPGESLLDAFMVCQISMTLIPWILFDFEEKRLLAASLVTCYVIFFSQSWLSTVLVLDLDNSMFKGGIFYYATSGMGIIIISLSLFFLLRKNHRAGQKNTKLLSEVSDQNQAMQEQQDELSKNLEEVKRAREEDEKRSWAAQGLTEINQILRANQDQNETYQQLIAKLVKYLKANQGGLYVLENEDNQILRLEACYAYERKKFLNKEIEPGQGLVGQCFLEKESTYLTDIPDRYTYITSGLGKATPSYLFITPLILDEHVAGVIEIASFSPIEEHHQHFLQKAGEDIASAIRSKQVTARMSELLNQSRQQAEEMQATEEEMRQNMEELQATQEEMHRKSSEQESIIQQLREELASQAQA
ncbi:GAF domain-containing protein [Tunicatimonas pelagia]|uniref:GAF domain-containing protein n=1 Tax=Tunicatimonas pelagia TaxID=931531 RepID=UPI00266594E1|nr:GAF domain-containing protein [Tunicatimonas pelagia]WKN45696.1 GAF domain-containing protein [Tunicatimonas pelagia]